jgi:hypothetical protein
MSTLKSKARLGEKKERKKRKKEKEEEIRRNAASSFKLSVLNGAGCRHTEGVFYLMLLGNRPKTDLGQDSPNSYENFIRIVLSVSTTRLFCTQPDIPDSL